jgi:hypothetical protein
VSKKDGDFQNLAKHQATLEIYLTICLILAIIMVTVIIGLEQIFFFSTVGDLVRSYIRDAVFVLGFLFAFGFLILMVKINDVRNKIETLRNITPEQSNQLLKEILEELKSNKEQQSNHD